MKVKVWRIIVASILFAVLSEIIHILGALLSINHYANPIYFQVWSELLMSSESDPSPAFFAFSFAFALIGGILVTLVYAWIRGGLKGKGTVSKGLFYGFILFLVAGIPGFLSIYLLINIPAMLNVIWMVEGLIIYLVGGIIIASLVK